MTATNPYATHLAERDPLAVIADTPERLGVCVEEACRERQRPTEAARRDHAEALLGGEQPANSGIGNVDGPVRGVQRAEPVALGVHRGDPAARWARISRAKAVRSLDTELARKLIGVE